MSHANGLDHALEARSHLHLLAHDLLATLLFRRFLRQSQQGVAENSQEQRSYDLLAGSSKDSLILRNVGLGCSSVKRQLWL
jgi:hypothetical protein